jgi:DNA-binding transcriptional LysR family regulator
VSFGGAQSKPLGDLAVQWHRQFFTDQLGRLSGAVKNIVEPKESKERTDAFTSFTDANALMEAAVAGQGIALGRLSVTRSDILAGRLVRLSEHSLRVSYCHYAAYPIASEANPALVAFRDWLIEEASR